MGGGTYSSTSRSLRTSALGYDTKSAREIFVNSSINNAMNPSGLTVRESRDSAEHPNSLAIILALDVTGSMGSVPHFLVKEGLPKLMEGIIESGIADPQVLFLGIGDHECDHAPLQVGQFESSDELLDKWLTDIYLEGGGGGNAGESYLLAWYLAAYHSSIDCYEKRNRKGYLFTVGDEPTLRSVSRHAVSNIMGSTAVPKEYSAAELLTAAMEKYNVYHINIAETTSGSRPHVVSGWRELLADNLIVAQRKEDVAHIIARIVSEKEADSPYHGRILRAD